MTTTPKLGGTVVIGHTSDVVPSSMLNALTGNWPMFHQIYDTLTRYDHATLNPLPELALSWDESSDGTQITFHLRDGVKFHSGRAFTADDVIWSIQRIQDASYASQLRSTALDIKSMTVVSPTTLQLTLQQRINNLFDIFELMPIVDRDTFPARNASGNFRLVGTGPFMWKEWKPGESLSMVKNPNYWKPGLPYLDGVQLVVQPEVQSVVTSLQSGQTQLATDLVPTNVLSVKNDPNISLTYSDTPPSAWYVGCNVQVPPLDRKEVRQAISYAVDRQKILSSVFDGHGLASALPWPKYSPAYDKSLETPFDPAKARQLLASAGVSNPTLTMTVVSTKPAAVAMAQIVQFNLEQIGFKINPVSLTFNDFVGKLIAGSFPGIWIDGSSFHFMHPATLSLSAYPMNATKNSSNFVSDDYKTLATAAWLAPNDQAAKDAYQKLSQFLLDQRFVINLVTGNGLFLNSKRLSGLKFDVMTQTILEQAGLS